MKIDYLNGDPADYGREEIEWMVHELQDRLRYVSERVETNEAVSLVQKAFGLKPATAKMLLQLSKGRVETRDALASVSSPSVVAGLDVEHKTGPKLVDVQISYLRKGIKQSGLKIETLYGIGYQMDPASCEKLKHILSRKTVDLIPSDVDIEKHKLPIYVVRHIHK
jgi:hypothetical protein